MLGGVVDGVFHKRLHGHGRDVAGHDGIVHGVLHLQTLTVAYLLDAQVVAHGLQILPHGDDVALVVERGAQQFSQRRGHNGNALVAGVLRQAVDGFQRIV